MTVGRVPIGSPRVRDFILHGFPETLEILAKQTFPDACGVPLTACQEKYYFLGKPMNPWWKRWGTKAGSRFARKLNKELGHCHKRLPEKKQHVKSSYVPPPTGSLGMLYVEENEGAHDVQGALANTAPLPRPYRAP